MIEDLPLEYGVRQWKVNAAGGTFKAMTVVRADTMGVCMGVKRALGIVEEVLAANPGTPVYTLGPLIHNRRVVDEFRVRGVVPVEDLSEVHDGIVIIRAHGIGPEQLALCKQEGLRCVDATCPHVRRIHEKVSEFDAKGFHAIIVGDAEHGEVKGIRGYARRSSVIATEEEAETVALPSPSIVVSQTTFARAASLRIAAVLRRRDPGITVFETTCAATERRQESILRLAAGVQALLVIGGRESANTRWLYEAARSTGRPSWQIEGAGDIPPEIRRFARVGISAGASTPDTTVDEVEKVLLSM